MRLPDLTRSDTGQGPVYRRIAAHIRGEIESGALASGSRLPPIRHLARELGVNRDTVALAYDSLAGEGWVDPVVGRGTFVREEQAQSEAAGAPAEAPGFAPCVEALLDFEQGRPRYGTDPDVVPLHSLIPDPALYPVDEFRRCLNAAIGDGGANLFLYGSPQGHRGLRETLAERFAKGGYSVDPDEVVLCHGASQGISLAVRLFAAGGDAIAVESPTYHNVLATLVGLGVESVPVPMGDDGPDPDALEATLARPEVKAFYTIPSFHNPLGTTSSVASRRRVLDIAARAGVPVIEDAFEMDLRHTGRPVPALAALDTQGLVVHLFSFSKSLFPGVRVGSVSARGRAVEALLALKHASDLSDSLPLQAGLDRFVRSGGYERHLGRMRRMLRSRTDALLDALRQELPAGSRFTEPQGGYQVWVELPFELDTRDLLPDAAREGVLFAPGSNFLCDRRPSSGMRLTLAQADEEGLRRGAAALGRAVASHRTRVAAPRRAVGVDL